MAVSTYAASGVAVTVILAIGITLYFSWHHRRREKPTPDLADNSKTISAENSQPGAAKKLHQPIQLHHHIHLDHRRRPHNSICPRGVSLKHCLFSWDDHPSLVNDAVENGWSQFAFTGYMCMSSSTSPSSRATVLGLCSSVGENNQKDILGAEISWEVCQDSADFMQKIRLNSGLKNAINAISVIRTALPLPGPPLASFPQEAYFEITILSTASHDDNELSPTVKEGERIKLRQENCNSKASSESLVPYFTASKRVNHVDGLKLGCDNNGEEGEGVILSVGLSNGGSTPLKLPGRYHGSIGFNSDGSVYLDGIKLVFESEKEDWRKNDRVIGCGFDPEQKKVFFTLDSILVHVINCKSEEFSAPLYPTMAANADIKVVVNLGQSVFKYRQVQRTPNPCFVGPLENSPGGSIGYEDSRELFSMGMLDSQWLNRAPPKASPKLGLETSYEFSDEVELFEIAVEESYGLTVPLCFDYEYIKNVLVVLLFN